MTFFLSIAVAAQLSAATKNAEKEINKVLEAQITAWNSGNIPGFMRGYHKSDETVFTSNGRIVRGWKTMQQRYTKTYGRGNMGHLKFSDVEINLLSKNSAWVLGHWDLRRGNATASGAFTLIFRKTRSGWKIIHDHTSNNP